MRKRKSRTRRKKGNGRRKHIDIRMMHMER